MTTPEHDTATSPPATPWLSEHDITILQAARGILRGLDDVIALDPGQARVQGMARLTVDSIFSVLSGVSVYGPAPIPDEQLYTPRG